MAIPRFPYIRSSSRRSRRSCWDSGGETELGGELNSSVFVNVFPAQDTIKLLWADPNVFALDLEARSWRRGRGLSRDTKLGRDVGQRIQNIHSGIGQTPIFNPKCMGYSYCNERQRIGYLKSLCCRR